MKIKNNDANIKYIRYFEEWKDNHPAHIKNIPDYFFEIHSGDNTISPLGNIGNGTAVRIAVKAKTDGYRNVKLIKVFIDREIEVPLKVN